MFLMTLAEIILTCLLVVLPSGDVQCFCSGEPNPLDTPVITQQATPTGSPTAIPPAIGTQTSLPSYDQ